MSDSIVQTIVIVLGVIAVVWPLLYALRAEQTGANRVKQAENAIQIQRLEDRRRAIQVEGRKP